MNNESNSHKKYPIMPTQILSARSSCKYCRQISTSKAVLDNTEMCSFCGVGNDERINALLINLFEKTNMPMALIERVNSECVTYCDDKKYNNINYYEFKSKESAESTCYEYREKYDFLNNLCNKQDNHYAKLVFDAIDNDTEDFFIIYRLSEDRSIEYYSYICPFSKLTEIIIPLYIDEKAVKHSERGVFGLLIFGQVAIGCAPSLIGESIDNGDNAKLLMAYEETITDSYIPILNEFVSHTWEKASNKNRAFSNIDAALYAHTDHILHFRGQLLDELYARETNYLRIYQSKLTEAFLSANDITFNNKHSVESIKSRIKTMFDSIWNNFDLSLMRIFIPDLELKSVFVDPIIKGEISYNAKGSQSLPVHINLNVNNLPEPDLFEIPVNKLINKGAFIIKDSSNKLINLDNDKVNNGYYEFYTSANGDGIDKTIFAVFLEWNTLPLDYIDQKKRHKDFFRVLVGICSAEIMAYIASKRANKLSAFAEETRHDLAHRLQTLNAHNKSFEYDCENYFIFSNKSFHTFHQNALNYIHANRELYETLLYMRDELDSENVFREPKEEDFNIFTDVLIHLRQMYNAPWHPRNSGKHELFHTPINAKHNRLRTDKIIFRRIIMNLLDNAYKYSSPKTNVYVECRYVDKTDNEKSKYEFDITNFGYGIVEELSKSMFERGTRGAYAAAGNGLGLYIARELAERIDGDLNFICGVKNESNNLYNKKINGLISTNNITIYNDLNKLDKKYNERIKEIKKNIRDQVVMLSNTKEPLTELCNAMGKPNVYHAIMKNPNDRQSYNQISEANKSIISLIDESKEEIYRVTFRLTIKASY